MARFLHCDVPNCTEKKHVDDAIGDGWIYIQFRKINERTMDAGDLTDAEDMCLCSGHRRGLKTHLLVEF